MDRATLRSDPMGAQDGIFFTIGTDVVFGGIVPQTLRTGVGLEQIGTPLSDVGLRVEYELGGEPTILSSWGDVLENAPGVELKNGGALTFVLLGPGAPLSALGIRDESEFNAQRIVAVPNDPARALREAVANEPNADAGR
jgi:hypothetical protein